MFPSSATHLIDRFMPSWSLRQVDRIPVAASPEATWQAVRAVDLYRTALIRGLFELRTLPDRLAARLRGRRYHSAATATIDDIGRSGDGPGFRILDEQPGTEVVVGAIGKFWQPSIPFAAVAPADFAAFSAPGFGKVAWCLRVDPRVGGGAWIGVDVRVSATDAASWRRFERYWLLIGRFSHLIRSIVLADFRRRLHPGRPDFTRALPGDDLLAHASAMRTDSVTIEAPISAVWPWLVQMGCRRAGWYSYDRLDNGGVPSASTIIPALQHIAVGDLLPATPSDPGGFAVLRVEEPHVLVLGSPGLLPPAQRPPGSEGFGMFGARYLMTWAFVLEPIGETATRLIVRVRGDMAAGPRATLTSAAVLSLHAVMEHEQLRNLKRRAETTAAHVN